MNQSIQSPATTVPLVCFEPRPLVLPSVVFHVRRIIQTGAPDMIEQLERAIANDPTFAGRMLGLASSPLYGARSAVTTIKQAICLLGTKTIGTLALTVGAAEMFECKNKEDATRARLWWRLSCDSGLFAKWLAKRLRIACGEEAYLAGILHMIGKVQYLHSAPGTYDKVELLISRGSGVLEAERRVYGIDCQQLAVDALTEWGLPVDLIKRPPTDDGPETPEAVLFRNVRALTHIARQVSNPDAPVGSQEINPWALQILKIDAAELESLTNEGRTEMQAAKRAA